MVNLLLLVVPSLLFNRALSSPQISSEECPPSPTTVFPSNSKLPNPFVFLDGTNVTTRKQWNCRRAEVRKLFLDIEYGPLPPAPPVSNMSAKFTPGTLNNGTIDIDLIGEKNNVTLKSKIVFPADVTTPKPYPVVIVYGSVASIPLPPYAAVIYWSYEDFTGFYRPGVGRFFDLYPAYRSTTGAWAITAWGLSRIIDALELLQGEIHLDTERIAIAGCSRNGKAALLGGALDERVALTIAQESGEGGDHCWRIIDWERGAHKPIQACDRVVECPTDYSPFAPTFGRNASRPTTLPFDHHLLAALIAPRGLLLLQNYIDWQNPSNGFSCLSAARTVWEALGAKGNLGWSMDGSHSHCQFPKEKQGPELDAFFDKFLGNRTVDNLNVWRNVPEQDSNLWRWVDWVTPNLG